MHVRTWRAVLPNCPKVFIRNKQHPTPKTPPHPHQAGYWWEGGVQGAPESGAWLLPEGEEERLSEVWPVKTAEFSQMPMSLFQKLWKPLQGKKSRCTLSPPV